jgi:hypothetical protein
MAGEILFLEKLAIEKSYFPVDWKMRFYIIILVVAQGATPLAQALNAWLIEVA